MVTMEAISHFLHSQPCFGTVFVGGEFVPVESGATFATVSPTTEDVLLDSCRGDIVFTFQPPPRNVVSPQGVRG